VEIKENMSKEEEEEVLQDFMEQMRSNLKE
jgi:hypothetical protein